MSANVDLFAHASATVSGGNITVARELGCQLTRTSEGLYNIVTAAGQGAALGDLKASVWANDGSSALIANLEFVSATEFNLRTYDAAGAVQDAAEFGVSLERIART